MANHISRYRTRMGYNGGNLGEAYNNNTIEFIERAFQDSPTFRIIGVNSFEKPHITQMDARVIDVERMGSLKEVLLRPSSEGLNEGTYVKFDGHTWLIFDKFNKDKVLVEQCNRKIKWYDSDGNLNSFNCIASAQDLGSKAKQSKNEIEFNKFDVSLPTGQLFVFVELRPETQMIDLGYRFIFGRNSYEVTGIDDTTIVREVEDNTYGVLQLTVKLSPKRKGDDFKNHIAENDHKNKSDLIVETPKDKGKGGVIW